MGNVASRLQESGGLVEIFKASSSGAPRQDQTKIAERRSRYDSCIVLVKAGIANVIWLEDALALHGSNTRGCDLNLLVADPASASACLRSVGYHSLPPSTQFEYDSEFSNRGVRLALPKNASMSLSQGSIEVESLDIDTAVTLLPAHDWDFDLQPYVGLIDVSPLAFRPSLSCLLDSLMCFWLRLSSADYTSRLRFSLFVGVLILYCYQLTDGSRNSESVRAVEYGKYLRLEHRELHYDIVASLEEDASSGSDRKNQKTLHTKGKKGQSRRVREDFTTVARHQYHVRKCREIQEGVFTPVAYEKGYDRGRLEDVAEE